MKCYEIRQKFLGYFKDQRHEVVPSASLMPLNDKSLLFVNAGMVPFKAYFLHPSSAPYSAATSCQRVLRVGGKHNDLENVGHTARHLTFFEMLGNFSFGDYAKSKAIRLAWNFLTGDLGLDKSKLWITVYQNDDETFAIWRDEIGLAEARIIRCGDKDNFWSMGDTGPCGPCTEVFYDLGPEVAGGLPGTEQEDGDRYVEVWNVVFMQYDRQSDGSLHALPAICVDTGMGLERIAAVMQDKVNVFDIDAMQCIAKALRAFASGQGIEISHLCERVVADHMRAAVWMIHDQIRPSNEGRGYVLRRLIRRALRFTYMQKLTMPLLHRLVDAVCKSFHHPSLDAVKEQVQTVLRTEEEHFMATLQSGISLFEKHAAHLDETIPGDLMFKLYDTYGFPLDLMEDMARERGLSMDHPGYMQCMEAQKKRSKANQRFVTKSKNLWVPGPATTFVGYEDTEVESEVLALWSVDHQPLRQGVVGTKMFVVLQTTSFYAESGGQVGDKGELLLEDGVFVVEDTQKVMNCFLHIGVLQRGRLCVGDRVRCHVSAERLDIARNHSATHLLHAALKQVLGQHVVQKGSLVLADRLRFDFSHTQALTQEEWSQVECHVHKAIMQNTPVIAEEMSMERALQTGAEAHFSEKYGDTVRVILMGEVSKELCGGTHVQRTGDIGGFVLTQESAVAQGVRRLEAKTGVYAWKHYRNAQTTLAAAANRLKTSPAKLLEKMDMQNALLTSTQKKLVDAQKTCMRVTIASMAHRIVSLEHGQGLVAAVDNAYRDLRQCVEIAHEVFPDAVVVLLQKSDKTNLRIALGVPKALEKFYDAKALYQTLIAETLGGKGGGKHSLVQGACVTDLAIDAIIEQLKLRMTNS
jgi:alanyl-tRNA synthetase